jgi:putative phosphoesterase
MTRVLVLADTHIRSDRRRELPRAVVEAARAADAILHAGDVTAGHVLDELADYAPVYAVRGNNDRDLDLPATVEADFDGVNVAMVHDSGPRRGRAARMRRRFPTADCVVFGHSHRPVDEVGDGGQRLFNPGSPIERRQSPWRSFGWLGFAGGAVTEHRVMKVE